MTSKNIPKKGVKVRLNEETKTICDTLVSVGGRPYIVGGYCRDSLLGIPDSKDVDIEVFNMDPSEIKNALSGLGRAKLVGESFGVFKISLGGTEFDVSLPRIDSKVGRGHKGIESSVDRNLSTRLASSRRDFTINSIMYDYVSKVLVDHHGGVDDIKNKVIRHTSDSFSDDPLRPLRAIQFASRLGFSIALKTTELCEDMKGKYWYLPKERVWTEWEKLLFGDNPERGLQALEDTTWLSLYPELAEMSDCPQDSKWHPEGDVWTHTKMVVKESSRVSTERGYNKRQKLVLALSSLMHDVGKPWVTKVIDGRVTAPNHGYEGRHSCESFLKSIMCPKEIRQEVIALTVCHLDHAFGEPSPRSVKRLSERLYPSNIEMWDALVECDLSGRHPLPQRKLDSRWLEIAEENLVSQNRVKPLLSGRTLIENGFTPSPEFSAIISESLDYQIENNISELNDILVWLRDTHMDDTYEPNA